MLFRSATAQTFSQRLREMRLAQTININGGTVNIIITDQKTKEKLVNTLQNQPRESSKSSKTVIPSVEQTPTQNLQSSPVVVQETKPKSVICPEGYICTPKVIPACPENMICTPKSNNQRPVVPSNVLNPNANQITQPIPNQSGQQPNSFENSQGLNSNPSSGINPNSGSNLISPNSYGGFGQPSGNGGSVNFGVNANYTIRF